MRAAASREGEREGEREGLETRAGPGSPGSLPGKRALLHPPVMRASVPFSPRTQSPANGHAESGRLRINKLLFASLHLQQPRVGGEEEEEEAREKQEARQKLHLPQPNRKLSKICHDSCKTNLSGFIQKYNSDERREVLMSGARAVLQRSPRPQIDGAGRPALRPVPMRRGPPPSDPIPRVTGSSRGARRARITSP